MDTETARKYFEEWADCEGFHLSSYTEDGCKKYAADHTQTAWWAWLESARRADRKAREGCCRILASLKVAEECADMYDKYKNCVLDSAIDAIRATIPEE